jgi:N-acetylmuramoyl-L-alanine amidase
MKIINHLLYQDDDMPYPFRESPNRGGTMQPKYLIMHYTAGPNADHAVRWLINPTAQASAHLVIGRDGGITQLVPFDTVAWHAGKSEWQGIVGLNSHSIGIELDNAGPLSRSGDDWVAWFGSRYPSDQVIEAAHKFSPGEIRGWHLYTPDQLFAAIEAANLLVRHYQLRDVLGHEDIAPGRKSDPGPAFPMESFRSRLFGRPDEPEVEQAPEAPKVYRATSKLNVRGGPGSQYAALEGSPLPRGAKLAILAEQDGWFKVDVLDIVNGVMDLQGWVHGRYIEPMP